MNADYLRNLRNGAEDSSTVFSVRRNRCRVRRNRVPGLAGVFMLSHFSRASA